MPFPSFPSFRLCSSFYQYRKSLPSEVTLKLDPVGDYRLSRGLDIDGILPDLRRVARSVFFGVDMNRKQFQFLFDDVFDLVHLLVLAKRQLSHWAFRWPCDARVLVSLKLKARRLIVD
jgi:hypothetical protein